MGYVLSTKANLAILIDSQARLKALYSVAISSRLMRKGRDTPNRLKVILLLISGHTNIEWTMSGPTD